MSTPDDKALAA